VRRFRFAEDDLTRTDLPAADAHVPAEEIERGEHVRIGDPLGKGTNFIFPYQGRESDPGSRRAAALNVSYRCPVPLSLFALGGASAGSR